MHAGDNPRSNGRLSVYFEQDLAMDETKQMERIHIRGELLALDDNNNKNNKTNESIELNESLDYNNVTHPPVVRRRKNNNTHQQSRSRERSFVYAAGDAVVGGARTVARTFKRMSLIESSSTSSVNSSQRERTPKEIHAQDGVDRLKANAKLKQHYNSTPSLPQSYNSAVGPLQSSGSAQSLGSSPSPSPRSSQAPIPAKGGNTTAKQHDQQPSAVAAISSTSAAAAATGAGVVATAAAANGSVVAAPPATKEKKRKEVSSSRVKKFHRHFSQVSKDEKLINYFSCALVGDIPLQGHLYITDQHFAFYSNVFGYVTKVVIPTTSVTKISKEKTAKIIPNAVGVATADERHVFGSFISRESAFRLMCTVCAHLANGGEILPKPLPVDVEVEVELTEEYLIDDDSSCSISGNESPAQLQDPTGSAASEPEQLALLRQRPGSDRHSDLQSKILLDMIDGPVTIRSSAPPVVHYEEPPQQLILIGAGSRPITSYSSATPNVSAASSSGPPSSSSSPITVVGMVMAPAPGPPGPPVAPAPATPGHNPPQRSRLRIMAQAARSHFRVWLPTLTEMQVLYLGILLAVILAFFSVFLLYRIMDIEAKTSLYNMPVDFNLLSGNDEDIFAEALRWQKELQDKSTAEAHTILAKNLEQISKVRRSLETLSMLIHDRSADYAPPPAATEPMPQTEIASDVSD